MSTEIAKTWMSKVKKLSIDESIFFRVANKEEQTTLANAFEKEREMFAKLDPVHASQLKISKVLKSLNQYVLIERKYRTPYIAFFKAKSGELSKITVDPDRQRQIYLMVKDKKTRDEIEEALNGLTDDEIDEFYPEENNF